MPERLREITHAIVPLNSPKRSKLRLSRILNARDRSRLTLIMLDHVLSALLGAHTLKSVTVVCADRNVARIVRKTGAKFVWEGRSRGLNSAVILAQRKLTSDQHFSVLIIHSDLPLLTHGDVDTFVRTARPFQVGIVPSRDGVGTNAVFLKSPLLIRTRFGRESFSTHLRLIRKNGLRYKSVRVPGISFDLDNAEDANWLIQNPTQNDVSLFLRERLHEESRV